MRHNDKRKKEPWLKPANAHQRLSQMQAAMRPDCPRIGLSRRCEKNLEVWVTVHQGGLPSLPWMRSGARPSVCRR